MTAQGNRNGFDVAPCTAALPLDTSRFFATTSTVSNGAVSAIDELLTRIEHTNTLTPDPGNFDPIHAQILLAGIVAATESFFRSALRATINIDPITRENAYEKAVSFAAAVHLPHALVPEAIFEQTTFLSKKSIWVDTLQEIVEIKGNPPNNLVTALDAYLKVCQLRHCIVHRSGRLGASNAMKLGIASHSMHMEKVVQLDFIGLQECVLSCEMVARTVNNLLFRTIISRIPASKWRRNFGWDRKWFTPIYNGFAVTRGSRASPSAKDTYKACI